MRILPYAAVVVARTLTGVGIGLAQPALYVRCTSADRPEEAATRATPPPTAVEAARDSPGEPAADRGVRP